MGIGWKDENLLMPLQESFAFVDGEPANERSIQTQGKHSIVDVLSAFGKVDKPYLS